MTWLLSYDWLGSGAVTDVSGSGRGFTPTGTSARTAAGGGYTYGGARPNAIGFAQGAAEIQVGPALTGLQTTSRTSCGWVKIAGSYTGHFMEFYRNPADDTGVWTWLYLSGTFRARAKNAVGGLFERIVTPNTAYRFIAMTHDGANLKVYQSDSLGVVAQVGANVAMASAVWNADVFRIFDQAGSGVVLGPWDLYDTALTLSELQAVADTPPDARTAAGLNFGTATGSGAAQALALSKAPTLGPAAGSGVAQAMTWAKSLTLGQAAGSGAAQALAAGKGLALGAAGGAGTAQSMGFTAAGLMSLGTATGTGTPQPMGWAKAWALGTATGPGAPQALTRSKALTFGTAAGSGTAQALTRSKQLTFGPAAGSGAAQALAFTGPSVPYTAPSRWSVLSRATGYTAQSVPGAVLTQRRYRFTAATRRAGYTAQTRKNP